MAVAGTEAELGAATEAVAASLDDLDRACSRFRRDSDLSHLNRAAGGPVLVGPLLAEALSAALRAARLTSGLVDPTIGAALLAAGYDEDFATVRGRQLARAAAAPHPVPGWRCVQLVGDPPVVTLTHGAVLDLGATAKALGADRAALDAHRVTGCGILVGLGGDIALAGEPPPHGWAVRVTEDRDAGSGEPGQLITLRSGGLATSSSRVRRWRQGGEVMHHIIDPRTGAPAVSPWRTVSVAAASCVDANTASTAVLVLGAEAPLWLQSRELPARLVEQDGTVVTVNGWPEETRR